MLIAGSKSTECLVMLACAGSKFKQNKALMQQPDPCLDIPEDEDLVDVKPVAAKPPKVCVRKYFCLLGENFVIEMNQLERGSCFLLSLTEAEILIRASNPLTCLGNISVLVSHGLDTGRCQVTSFHASISFKPSSSLAAFKIRPIWCREPSDSDLKLLTRPCRRILSATSRSDFATIAGFKGLSLYFRVANSLPCLQQSMLCLYKQQGYSVSISSQTQLSSGCHVLNKFE